MVSVSSGHPGYWRRFRKWMFMSGSLVCNLLASNASETLQHLGVEEARKVVDLEVALAKIATDHRKGLASLLLVSHMSHFLAQVSGAEECDKAWTTYERVLSQIDKIFREKCKVDTVAYNKGIEFTLTLTQSTISRVE